VSVVAELSNYSLSVQIIWSKQGNLCWDFLGLDTVGLWEITNTPEVPAASVLGQALTAWSCREESHQKCW